MPSIDMQSIRVPGEMDRYPLHRPDATSRHAGCRSTLDVSSTLESSPVARESFATCCDVSNTVNAVLFKKDTVTTLENEPNSAARLSQDTSFSHNARSTDSCSSQKEFDRPAALCDHGPDTSVIDHRNRHGSTRRSDAMRYSHAADAFSIMRYGFNQMLGLMVIDWITNSSWRRLRTCFPLLICFLLCVTQCTAHTCSVGLSTPGWTWPQGDIVIEHGKPLRMFCLLNQTIVDYDYPGKGAEDLRFFRNDQELESEFVTVINETTIELFIKSPPASDDMYNCKLKINNSDYIAVCLNKVVVGFPPRKPKHFDCVSYNWESFNCTWEPEHNFVHTTYDLMFQLPGRSGAMYYCPLATTAENSCMWDIYSDPIYRQPYPFYIFTLKVSNAFDNISFTYRIQHYPNVIPAKPYNLTLINKTSESALLYWELPFPMATFPVGVHHKIMYQHQWDHEKNWKIVNITHPKNREQWLFNLTGLEYANTVYDVRIYLKSSTAVRPDRWSDFSVVTFRTSSKLPGAAPRTDIGSFEIAENNGSRDVYLYWQAIPQNKENGDNFKYQIIHVEENGRNVALTPSETTRTYAKLKGINLNSYLFEIISTNEVGANSDRARIYVPNQQEIPHELAFTKIAFENGLYELSWKPPFVDRNIVNYTIFWCDNERDRPYQCTGYLDWVHVPKSTTIYNITVPDPSKVYQFAISVNTERGSSGMIWSSCTVIHNKVLGKMKSVWINRIGSHFIEVGWKLDCSDRIGIIEGFNIYYCPIMSPLNVNCNGPMLNSTIKADSRTIHGIVDNLKPYTTYMLNVAVLTKSGEGLRSDPLYNTTLEAAPSSPPENVRITDFSNTTIHVSWKSPKAMNGVLRYFEIDYNGQVKKVEEIMHVKLMGLKPYTNYSIRVSACTVKCSEKSPIVSEITRIGVPGKINMPLVRFVNSSQVSVQWEPPQEPAGPIKAMYYEIEYGNGLIQNVSKLEVVHLPIPDCQNVKHREQKHKFRVRAVNTNHIGEILKGSWSDFGEGNCWNNGQLSKPALITVCLISAAFTILFIALLVYMFKRLWIKCRAMRDVEVKLPPGLAPDMKLLEKNNELHIRQPSADSSGCSSGQESVTSSLTAESQVCSDSGTEVDAVHTSSDKVKSQPVREMTHLRQRSTTRIPASLLSEVTPCWESYVKVGNSGEAASEETASLARSTPNLTNSTMSKSYSPSQHAWSSTNYISMPSSCEALLSNPSLIPRNITTGGNSGDGDSSKYGDDNNDGSHGDNNSSDSNNDSSDESGDALISIKFEDDFEKEKQKLTIDELDKMRSIIEQDYLNKKIDILASHINPDKMTMATPYVQAGLIDEIPETPSCIPKHIQARNSNLMCGTFKVKDNQNLCKREYMSFPPAFPTNTTLTSASPKYIFASIIPEGMAMPAMKTDQESLPQKTLHDPHSSTTSDTSYNLTSSAHEIQPQEQQEKVEPFADMTEDIDESGNKDYAVDTTPSWPTTDATVEGKQLNSSYITLANLSPPSAGPSYVRLEKMPSSLPQTATSQSDEQYAEVTVVPSTVQ